MLIIEGSNSVVIFQLSVTSALGRQVTCHNDGTTIQWTKGDSVSIFAAIAAMRAKAIALGGNIQRVYDLSGIFAP